MGLGSAQHHTADHGSSLLVQLWLWPHCPHGRGVGATHLFVAVGPVSGVCLPSMRLLIMLFSSPAVKL